jgi:hypothetical protein
MKRSRTILCLGAVLAAVPAEAQGTRAVPVIVNGETLDSRALLLTDVNRTVLPMRTLFESLGARVEWDPAERAVYAWIPDRTGVRLAVGERTAQTLRVSVDPRPGNWGSRTGSQELDAPAMMVGRRVFVPLRFASEALNADVRYASFEPAVHIRTQRVAGVRAEAPGPAPTVGRESAERRVEPELARARSRMAEMLEVTLELESSRLDRDQEETVMRLLVRNSSDRRLVLPFASGQEFDLQVLQEGHVVWSWARNRPFSQGSLRRLLQPGHEVVYVARWNLQRNNGRKVPPGRYLVRGILMTDGDEPPVVAEERIVVTR